MNANSRPRTPLIKDWLDEAVAKLENADITSARLDSELILAEALGKSRTYLHGHDDETVSQKILEIVDDNLNRRLKHEPLAYILGYKEFYGHSFKVTSDTLIPRPESETIIGELTKIIKDDSRLKLIDIGTGSGCLGITTKLIFPHLDVTLTDISDNALKVAEYNAKKLGADVKIFKSDLLTDYADKPDVVIANLPYVDSTWSCSPETVFEPNLALFAKDNGLNLIKKLISQVSQKLNAGGYLILESDPRQHDEILRFAAKKHFDYLNKNDYILTLRSSS